MLKCSKILSRIAVTILASILWTTSSYAAQADVGIVKASMLNMRQSPHTSTEIIEKIPENCKVEILETSNGWYKVTYNGKVGWVFGTYVSVESAKQQEGQPETITSVNNEPVVDKTIVIDKTLTTATNSLQNTVSQNDNLIINAPQVVEDKTVLAVKANDPANNPAIITEKGVVTASTLNIREGAGTEFGVAGRLDQGEKLVINEKSNGWYKISTSNGATGWVFGEYVSIHPVTLASRGDSTEVSPAGDSSVSDTRSQIVAFAKKYQGVKYKYGGSSPSGFDCSGYVKYVYDHFGIGIERVAASQATQGKLVSKSDLKPGDLVFFDTNGNHNYINHSGIYIGNGQFIHASSGSSNKKVVISDLTSGFYKESYMTARRFLD